MGTNSRQDTSTATLSTRSRRLQRRGHKRQAKRLHRRAARRRKEALHRFSRKIVDSYQNIVIGDVSSLKCLKLVKTRMAKSVLDSGWGMLKTQLHYKAQQGGRSVFIVNEKDTTRECSSCHALTGPTGLDMLVVRTWICGACGCARPECQCWKEYPVRVEVLHVRAREQAFAVRCAAEPGISPARGRDKRTHGGGMNAGNPH
jgi:IS605 OrfB family transposase